MNQKTVAAVLLTIACIAVLVFAISFGRGAGDGQENGEDGSNEISGNLLQGEIPLIDSKNAEEPIATSIGIDVSKWQGIIDFQKVRESGIDFVMVRVGYRTAKDGKIEADENAAYNLQKAGEAGLFLGAYFYSSAITVEEAREEADFVADFVAKYSITYPIAYDCEGHLDADSRNFYLLSKERTQIAIAFLDEIRARGYDAMFYASKGEMEGNAAWDVTQLEAHGQIWVAQYPEKPYPQTEKSSYGGTHVMWQYSDGGHVDGMKTGADVNLAYLKFDAAKAPKDPTPPEKAYPGTDSEMLFSECHERVTAKIQTNLRTWPGTDIGEVVHTLENGEEAIRTGTSDKGWSRVEWQGQVLYAITSYLTTDFTDKQGDDDKTVNMDGIEVKTTFEDINDYVTAKEVVNLRSLPSTTHESSRILGTLSAGEKLKRTGVNRELGWSRLEYNGITVYAITSYLENIE
ncbi:MAG: glycoside hydrolase family 25 [Lachnospiraceae bacterium]|nr:glycoside hydrolase family 25 [Lachnospiraceae bacterium]